MSTAKGRELRLTLERKLQRGMLGYSDDLSLICRHATSYARIQERWCSEEMSDNVETLTRKREAMLEAKIMEIADELPGVRDIKFSGDPRGCTVKLVMHDSSLWDDWGQEGICIPGG